ncbi:MAG: hypothetical protein HFJ02_06585 [Bacilli bacterium]|nr:hypothetical protein [Bacilli bacterium]
MLENKIIILPVFPIYDGNQKFLDFIQELFSNQYKLIIIDDGNGEREKDYFHQMESIAKVITHKNNEGKGASIKEALKYIREHYNKNTIIMTFDWEDSFSISELETVCKMAFVKINTLVIGKKENENKIVKSKILGFRYELIDFLNTVSGSRSSYFMNINLKCKQNQVPIHAIFFTSSNSSTLDVIEKKIEDYTESTKLFREKVSLFTFALDYFLFLILTIFSNNHLIIANVFARLISSLLDFYKKRSHYLSFKEEAKRYFLTIGILLIIENILLFLFIQLFHLPLFIAKLFSEIIFVLLYYGVLQYFGKENGNS